MNAAARLVNQGVLSNHFIMGWYLTRQQLALFVLSLLVLMSAMSIIYVTYMTRIMHSAYQHGVLEYHELQVARAQLLLERSTWLMQSRVQHLAESEQNMVLPDHKSVVVIHE